MASSLSDCCLLIDGKTQDVAIKTNAPALYSITNVNGAEVAKGIAPTVVHLKRNDAPYTVKLKRINTSHEENGMIYDNLNGWLWGDLPCGIILCTTVDLATGAAWDLDKEVTINTFATPDDTTANAENKVHFD